MRLGEPPKKRRRVEDDGPGITSNGAQELNTLGDFDMGTHFELGDDNREGPPYLFHAESHVSLQITSKKVKT